MPSDERPVATHSSRSSAIFSFDVCGCRSMRYEGGVGIKLPFRRERRPGDEGARAGTRAESSGGQGASCSGRGREGEGGGRRSSAGRKRSSRVWLCSERQRERGERRGEGGACLELWERFRELDQTHARPVRLGQALASLILYFMRLYIKSFVQVARVLRSSEADLVGTVHINQRIQQPRRACRQPNLLVPTSAGLDAILRRESAAPRSA